MQITSKFYSQQQSMLNAIRVRDAMVIKRSEIQREKIETEKNIIVKKPSGREIFRRSNFHTEQCHLHRRSQGGDKGAMAPLKFKSNYKTVSKK